MNEEIAPMGVSQWLKHGEKYGYTEYSDERIKKERVAAYAAGKAAALEELSSWGNARMRNFHESELHGKIELMLKLTDQA